MYNITLLYKKELILYMLPCEDYEVFIKSLGISLDNPELTYVEFSEFTLYKYLDYKLHVYKVS